MYTNENYFIICPTYIQCSWETTIFELKLQDQTPTISRTSLVIASTGMLFYCCYHIYFNPLVVEAWSPWCQPLISNTSVPIKRKTKLVICERKSEERGKCSHNGFTLVLKLPVLSLKIRDICITGNQCPVLGTVPGSIHTPKQSYQCQRY